MDISIIAKEWVGTRFRYKGFTRNGCDCAGLLAGVLNELQIYKNIVNHYKSHLLRGMRYIDGDEILMVFSKNFIDVTIDNKKSGDIVLFSFDKKKPSHMGIVSCIEPLSFIHANRSVGRVVESVLDKYWIEKVYKVFRLQD